MLLLSIFDLSKTRDRDKALAAFGLLSTISYLPNARSGGGMADTYV